MTLKPTAVALRKHKQARSMAVLVASLMAFTAHAEPVHLELASQPLSQALREFARQTGIQVAIESELTAGKTAPSLAGTFQPAAALAALLEGSGLVAYPVNEKTYGIRLLAPEASTIGMRADADAVLRLAQSDASAQAEEKDAGQASGEGAQEKQTSDQEPPIKEELEEVVVTGSHIRGAGQSVGTNVITVDEEQIRAGGFSTVQDVVQSLPQNFQGGISEDTIDLRNSNPEKGTAINLRGLGFGSTLTLLNGRRIAAGGGVGSFTDISSIPLTAVEKIEILADGASALYGADAIGGVVNIVLKKEYDGAATQARLGSVTEGSFQEYLLGQNIGTHWSEGSALVALEYRHRDPMFSSERPEMQSDLRPYGGDDFRHSLCNPGTIFVGGQTYAIPPGQDGRSLTSADLAEGTANACNRSTGTNVLSEEERWSAFATARQRVGEVFEVYGDIGFTNREIIYGNGAIALLAVPSTNAFYVNPTGGTETLLVFYDFTKDLPLSGSLTGKSVNAALGAKIDFGDRWQIATDFSGSFQDTDALTPLNPDPSLLAAALADSNPATAFNPFGDGSYTSPQTLSVLRGSAYRSYAADSEFTQATLIADGPLFRGPGGDIKLAVGAERRRQTVDTVSVDFRRSQLAPTEFPIATFERTVNAGFAELYVPVVGAETVRPAIERLEFSVAGRYESYSDYGDTFVPKVGFRWVPVSDLSVRGTWSKAFKAPHATELLETRNQWQIYDAPSPSGTGMSSVLWTNGGNQELTEETATIWTFGLNWANSLSGISAGISYFNVDFTNRIGFLLNEDLSDPTNAGAIIANPTAAQKELACRAPIALGNSSTIAPGDCMSAPVDFLLDARTRNQASVNESGIDLLGSYLLSTRYGDFSIDLNATYLLEYAVAQSETAPTVDVVNVAGNPVALRLRTSVGWSRKGVGLLAFINYADDYDYPANQDDRDVGSFTTIDMTASYRFAGAEWLQNLELSANVRNVSDESPPFYNNPAGMAYDPANADLLGRVVSLYVRKEW